MKAGQKVREPIPIPIVEGPRNHAGALPARLLVIDPKRTADSVGERKRING